MAKEYVNSMHIVDDAGLKMVKRGRKLAECAICGQYILDYDTHPVGFVRETGKSCKCCFHMIVIPAEMEIWENSSDSEMQGAIQKLRNMRFVELVRKYSASTRIANEIKEARRLKNMYCANEIKSKDMM